MQPTALRVSGWSFLDSVLIFALVGFLFLSGYAAFEGLFDIILSKQPALATERQRYYILGAVGLITAAMWALLEVALRRGQLRRRLPAALMYFVLALWSIGFGYGFWWKVIASRSETRTGIETAAAAVQKQVDTAENSVGLVEGLLASVIDTANAKQKREVNSGSSCGITSKPGDGPLSKLRSDVTNRISALKTNVERLWLLPLREVLNGKRDSLGQTGGGLKAAQAKLDAKLMRDLSEDERRRIYEEVRTISTSAINSIATLNSAQGRFFAREFTILASGLDTPPTNRSSTCYDPDLARDLRGAAIVADSNPALTVPEFEMNEGAAATAKAFNKIWEHIFWAGRQLPASIGLMTAGPAPEPLKRRDIIALIASIVVDLCICVFAFIRTRSPLDASHMFQPAHAGARAKLESAVRAFTADDNLDARKVFNACILRSGRSYYFILPHLSTPMSSLWRPGAIFLQNILIVLEAVHAVDGHYEPTGERTFWRSLVPGFGSMRLFEKAARQLREGGWGAEPAPPTGAAPTPLVGAAGLSLHRFRRTDLLEFLLLLRQDMAAPALSTVDVAPAIKAPPRMERWPTTTLRRMSAGLQQILSGIRQRTNARRSRNAQIGDKASVATANTADGSGSAESLGTAAHWKAEGDGEPAQGEGLDTEAPNVRQAAQSDLFLFSEFVADQRPSSLGSSTVAHGPEAGTDEPGYDPPLAREGEDVKTDSVVAEPETPEIKLEVADAEHASAPMQRLDEIFESIDDLNRAMSYARPDSARAGDIEGLAMTSRRLTEHLERAGLARTAEIGQRADPNFHRILADEPSTEPQGTITRINAQGYRETESGRLVREAQVVVSGGARAQGAA